MTDHRPTSRLRHAALPALIFIVVTLVAVGAALALWRSAESRDRARFEAESRVASVAVHERMERQIALLRGAAGLFAASDSVEAGDFNAYVERIDLKGRYPGVLGIGFAPHLNRPAERDAFVARMRQTAASDFHIWPAGDRPAYDPITYLSPLDRRNRAAIGFDMLTDPTRRTAMLRARDEGEAAASGRVFLVQEIETEKQPGFLVYLPVYRGGRVPVTTFGRARTLAGFVFSPLRARDLWNSVFSSDELRHVEVAIYDGAVAPANQLYQTGPIARSDALYYAETLLDVAGQPWIIVTATRPDFSQTSQRSLAWWTGGLGTLTALLLALAAWAQGRAALEAERARADLRRLNETLEARVDARTAEVSEAYAGLREEIERRQGAEEQVRQMQKMEAVGQLTGGIAHDFNNMLAIIIGSLDMAKRRVTDPERVSRLVDNAMEGATRAATLTQRLLAFSRRQPLSPERVDVNRLVAGMSDLIRRTLGETIRLETRLAADAWGTLVDVSQLENAILNLSVNARDAMPDGGSLVIETANRRLDDAYVQAHPSAKVGDYVSVAVTDTGEGMPPDVLAKAFEPFFTTKDVGKGTGLGLSQVFGFIQQSGGYVEIDSAPGEGTTVRIFLPWHESEGIGASDGHAATGARIPRGKADELILVVEDEDQVRLMSVEAMRDLGYTVVHAGGGGEALRTLREHPGIRLLVTDVVMPEMNGRELADAALRFAPDLKLLFTTGYTRDAIVKDGRVDEGVELLAKPFTLEQLAVKVRSVLDA
ncbi:MAG: hypothetical protein AVDCRST_MAG91-3398 [uncultured Sphingomonadaceae bacterium]|uniref:histidine kinase n=1 Tax=uncultured Sphingomonadaceae bacterium TaxID=169976 RepID=A0A6J4TYL2_9SPHN|nr:MAG: hypothetical protein AVDCRST_MAG91-3398 [uncultured Sphingomonadaceae bacterium]